MLDLQEHKQESDAFIKGALEKMPNFSEEI
jgi:hypothetical protein